MADGSDSNYIGYFEAVSAEKAPSYSRTYQQYNDGNSKSYEITSRTDHQDKQSGSYARYTAKEKVSYDETHRERGIGPVGVRDEFKSTKTWKVGDKSGYTEYYKEERVRDVRYDPNTKNGSSKRINYY